MSHLKRDALPASLEPNSVVSIGVPANRSLSHAVFRPQNTQHPIRIAQGSQAYAVSATLYLYLHSVGVAEAPASRSERKRKRSLGCHTKRRNSAVQITENTPDTTSVVRWKPVLPDDRYCMIAKLPPETSEAGQTSS